MALKTMGAGVVKTPMDYYVAAFRNPKDGSMIMRPVATNRRTAGLNQVVDRAKESGFCRGQTSDLLGLFGGFCQTMKVMAEEGYILNLGWFYIGGSITGTVDETGEVTSANKYRVSMRPSKDLKIDIENFSLSNVGANGMKAKVEHLSWVGSPRDLEIKKGESIQATGKNIAWSEGCTATVAYTLKDGSAHTFTLTPTESDFTHLKFAWPTELDDVPAGTEISFSFRLRGGNPEGNVMACGKAAVIAA